MRKALRTAILAAALVALGCSSGSESVKWPDLHPVSGVVKSGGKPVSGGYVQFRAADPAAADFLAGGPVGADGTYTVSTSYAHDKSATRKPGAPVGKHKVTYMPPGTEQSVTPVELPNPVTVNAGNNDIPIELPKK